MTTHECVDTFAREAVERHDGELDQHKRTLTAVRDEAANDIGNMAGDMAELRKDFAHLSKFLRCPPRVKAKPAKAGNGTGATLTDLIEEVTGSHTLDSIHPVKAWLQRKTGQAVWWVVAFVGIAGLTLAAEHAVMAVVHWLP